MAEHVYLQSGAARNYERSHGFYDHEGKATEMVELCQTVQDFLFKKLNPKENVTVLDIGVGRGDWIFLPLIQKLKASNKLAFAVGIDNSLEMLQYLKGDLKGLDNYMGMEWDGTNITFPQNDLIIVNKDIEELVYKWSPTKALQRFDLVIMMGSLHHLINWRQTINVVINAFLDSSGFILIFQRNADSDFVDGNFYKRLINSRWRELWACYYRERAKMGAPWEPELRISDYSPLVHALLDEGFSLEGDFESSWDVTYSKEEIIDWLETPVFSNFFRSLDTAMINQLKSVPEKKDEELSIFPLTIKEGWKFSIFRRGAI